MLSNCPAVRCHKKGWVQAGQASWKVTVPWISEIKKGLRYNHHGRQDIKLAIQDIWHMSGKVQCCSGTSIPFSWPRNPFSNLTFMICLSSLIYQTGAERWSWCFSFTCFSFSAFFQPLKLGISIDQGDSGDKGHYWQHHKAIRQSNAAALQVRRGAHCIHKGMILLPDNWAPQSVWCPKQFTFPACELYTCHHHLKCKFVTLGYSL